MKKIIIAEMMKNKTKPWYLSGGITKSNCLAAYKAIGAVSLETSYINLVNPGIYNLTAPTAAPTFDSANGWTFNGSSQYLATGITPTDHRTYTMIIRYSDAPAAPGTTGYACGWYRVAQGGGWMIAPSRGTGQRAWAGTTQFSVSPESLSGVAAIAGSTYYLNGGSDGTITTAALTPLEVYIGANKKDSGTPPIHTYFAGKIQAFAIYNTVLTATQVLAVTETLDQSADGTPEFTLVQIPDFQTTTESFPGYLLYLANWLTAHKNTLNILAVIHTGDIVDDANTPQYDSAETVWDALDTSNLPYLLGIGNHDYDVLNTRPTTVWNTYYPQTRYTNRQDWNGGFYEANHSENVYMILGDYLFLSLEWGTRDEVLTWADGIITANPTKKIIINTHSFIYIDGTLVTSTTPDCPGVGGDPNWRNGDEVWGNHLDTYPNLRMVLCGHHLGGNTAKQELTGNSGNKVVAMFANWQAVSPYPVYIRLLKFYDGGNLVKVRTYIINTGQYLTDANNQFTLTF